jgi:hypothetical protein
VEAVRREGRDLLMADDIEPWVGHALQKLLERGSMTVGEIMESADIDRFALPIARAWVESALESGFIARTGGSNESTRYNIAAAARTAARVASGRFVSEKARDGEPSCRF